MKRILSFNKAFPFFNSILLSAFSIRKDINKDDFDCSPGHLDWLKEIFERPPSEYELVAIIHKYFSEIELYHTSKPKELRSFYKNGLQILNMEKVESEFFNLVKTKIRDYKEDDIISALEKTRKFYLNARAKSSGNNICLHVDKKVALSEPCFSSFGGEYMTYIINNYPDIEIKRQLFEERLVLGIPTLFTVHLPLDGERGNDSLLSYIRSLLVHWASRYIYKQHLHCDVNTTCNLTYNLPYNVDSKCIYRHEHPKEFVEHNFYCDKCKKKKYFRPISV